MGDIDRAVRAARSLEGILTSSFGAQGKGLHEKLSSVEAEVPRETARNIRRVAALRNKLVHEEGFAVGNIDELEETARLAGLELLAIKRRESEVREVHREVPQKDQVTRSESKAPDDMLFSFAAHLFLGIGVVLAVILLLVALLVYSSIPHGAVLRQIIFWPVFLISFAGFVFWLSRLRCRI